MKYFSIVFLYFSLSVNVYSSSYSDDLSVYRLEEFCFRSLNQVNYNLLIQINIEEGDVGRMTEKKKYIFGDLFKSTYDFCSCIIDEYIQDEGVQTVLDTINVSDFWENVVPKYSSLSKDGNGCYQEKSAYDFIHGLAFD